MWSARAPNFMKIAPLDAKMREHPGIEPYLLHTGQHYDHAMSELFFNHLGLPTPDRYLEVGSGNTRRTNRQDHDRL